MGQPTQDRPTAREQPRRRPVVWVVAIVGLIIAYFIAAEVIPRWWAQRVADVVDGRLSIGTLYGLFIGFVFTLVPVAIALAVVRWRTQRRMWQGWVGWIALILLTATPNLMTLGIVVGRGGAAHAAERTLDSQGPGFRFGSLLGALAALAAAGGLSYLFRSRRRSRGRERALRDELRTREESRIRDDQDQA